MLAQSPGRLVIRQQVAELASYIEISKMGMPIGKQDQYALAFGGLNKITFSGQGVAVEPLNIAPDVQACLERGDLDEFARLLDYSWQEKRRLAPGLSTGFIDECYHLALQNGASAGKITGATVVLNVASLSPRWVVPYTEPELQIIRE